MFPHNLGLVWYRNTRVFRYRPGLVWYRNTRVFRYHSDNFDFDARSLLLQTAIALPCFCVLVFWVTVFTCIDVCERFVCERFGFRISLACFPRAGIFKKRFAVPKAQPLCRRHSPLLPRLSQRRGNSNGQGYDANSKTMANKYMSWPGWPNVSVGPVEVMQAFWG